MANYRDIGISDAPFVADVNLSAASQQWQVATIASTAGYIKIANGTSNPTPLGVLQNSPCLGQEAQVRVLGFSKAWVHGNACTARWGCYLFVSPCGQLEPIATESDNTGGSQVFARYMDATAIAADASALAQVYILGVHFGGSNLKQAAC